MTLYNTVHRHSRIRFVTPAQRHEGKDREILARADALYMQAREKRPERWSGKTRNWNPIGTVYMGAIITLINAALQPSWLYSASKANFDFENKKDGERYYQLRSDWMTLPRADQEQELSMALDEDPALAL